MTFRIHPVDRVGETEVSTIAVIDLVIDGQTVWPTFGEDAEPLEFFADDLLSHLAECWKPLVLRQTYPIPVQPDRPSLLPAKAAERWSSLPSHIVQAEEELVDAFEDVHELTNAFAGVYGLQPLWLLRSHNDMVMETAGRLWRLPFDGARVALAQAGDRLAQQLERDNPKRWARLTELWRNREVGHSDVLVSFAIGVSRQIARDLLREHVLTAPASFAEIASDNDEVRVAARLSGALRSNEIREVVELVRTCPPCATPELDALSRRAMLELFGADSDSLRPYEEGVDTARWLRSALGSEAEDAIDPFEVVRAWNVDIRDVSLGLTQLDAIAVWGSRHGPAVLLNTNAARVGRSHAAFRRNGAVRATLAHEICHLLLDRDTTLAAVEVLQSRMPVRIEQRARAFAGEFLLPSAAAARAWQDMGRTLDQEAIKGLLRRLCVRYGVTKSVATWQLEHGIESDAQIDLAAVLDRLVPNRRGFLLGGSTLETTFG